MRVTFFAGLALIAVACGGGDTRPAADEGGGGTGGDTGGDGDLPADASEPAPDAAPACVWQALEPGPFANVNTTEGYLNSCSMTDDGLVLYYDAFDPFLSRANIWRATRSSIEEPFADPRIVSELESLNLIMHVEISASGDEIFYRGSQYDDFVSATLTGPDGTFDEAAPIGLNGRTPSVSVDSLRLYYIAVGSTVMRAERAAPGEMWGNPIPLAEAGEFGSNWIDISRDELHLLMSRGTSAGKEAAITIASRRTVDEPFGEPVPVEGPIADASDLGVPGDVAFGPGDSQIVVTMATDNRANFYASNCVPSQDAPAAIPFQAPPPR